MTRKVAFVFDCNDLSKIDVNNFYIFPATSSAKEYLIENKIKYQSLEKYFSKDNAIPVNRIAQSWANSWYTGKYDVFKNLNLSLYNYFSKSLFALDCIENILVSDKVNEVFLGQETKGIRKFILPNFELISPIIRSICKRKGIKLSGSINESSWFLKYFVQFAFIPKIKRLNFKFSDKRLIIFTAHHYHIVNCMELIKCIKNEGKYEPIVIGRIGHAKGSLEENGIYSLDYNSNLRLTDLPIFLIWKIRFILETFKKVDSKIFRYKNDDLYQLFKPKLISLFLRDALNLKSYEIVFDGVLQKMSCQALLTVTNDSTNQAFLDISRRIKIPSIEIQHGITSGADSKYFKADKFAVWGKIPKMIYKNTGFDDKKMEITGWPAFEIYKDIKAKTSKIQVPPTITFLAQDPEGASLLFSQNTPEKNLDIFFNSVSKLKRSVKIIVRLHPRADHVIVKIAAKKYGLNFEFSNNEESLIHLLEKTDIVVGQTTSATLDAIIMHKPLIYLPSMRWPAKFVEGTGAVFEVKTTEEILEKINYILKNGLNKKVFDAQTKFINDYCNFSENSVENLTRLIDELANEKN